MSLDVTLYRKITKDVEFVFTSNITHNLGEMAKKAGIYEALWRPYQLKPDFKTKKFNNYDEEYDFELKQEIRASEIIPLLEKGLKDLKARPDYFKQFNSSNGWGTYKHFVPFVEEYLNACKEYPDALIEVSR